MIARKLQRLLYALVILLVLVVSCGNYMRPKDCTLDALYAAPDNTVDAIIVGSSHVYCGYVPAVLWDEYGISSFNIYGWSMPMRTAYAYIKETLKTQDLKVVMVDAATVCYGFGQNTAEIDEMNFNGNINFRMGLNRVSLMLKDVYESINRRPLGEVNELAVRVHRLVLMKPQCVLRGICRAHRRPPLGEYHVGIRKYSVGKDDLLVS